MNTFHSKLVKQLVDLGIINLDKIDLYASATRDDPHQKVWRCAGSGVVFLEPREKQELNDSGDLSYWKVDQRVKFLAQSQDDDERRANLIRPWLSSVKYLDIGTGLGGILDRSADLCSEIVAVEPQLAARNTLQKLGYQVYADISQVQQTDFDLVTLFHVFEHLTDPLQMLKEIKQRMAANGRLIIEVPHANDALLSLYECEAFKQFTLWSEHLVLHTKQSLQLMLASAGFKVKSIEGEQRYDLANHQYWLSQAKPGGHKIWNERFNASAKTAYKDSLKHQNLTDTLVVEASL